MQMDWRSESVSSVFFLSARLKCGEKFFPHKMQGKAQREREKFEKTFRHDMMKNKHSRE